MSYVMKIIFSGISYLNLK